MLAVVAGSFVGDDIGTGLAGVDVFLVLSGFLAGGLLWGEIATTGRLDLPRFWGRRIGRLAPAFLTMALPVTLAALALLMPDDLRRFGAALAAAALGASNLLVWREGTMPGAGALAAPLWHLWPLALVVQVSVALPLVMLALRRWRTVLAALLALLALASFAGWLRAGGQNPASALYLLPFRVWEPLAGVLLALALAGRAPQARPLAAAAGLALIVIAALLPPPGVAPHWPALPAVAGTLLVLANSASAGPAGALLRLPPVARAGQIAYPLWLWHWPVLALALYWRGDRMAPGEAYGWLGLALALALLTCAFVEEPLRRGALPLRRLLAGSLCGIAALAVLGLLIATSGGLLWRFGAETRGFIAASRDHAPDTVRCAIAPDGPLQGLQTCAIGPDGAPALLVWGDDQLRPLMAGLAQAADETGTPGLVIWQDGCPPLFGLAVDGDNGRDAACLAAAETLRAALPQMAVERMLLVGRWAYYAKGTGIGLDAARTVTLSAAPGGPYTGETQAALYAEAVAATLEEIGRSVPHLAVFRQVPEMPLYDSGEIARLLAHGRLGPADLATRLGAPPEQLAARVMEADAPFHAAAASGAIRLIDPWPVLCPERCTARLGAEPVYVDNSHLTNRGAVELRGLFAPFLSGAD